MGYPSNEPDDFAEPPVAAEGGWWVDAERLAPDCDDK